ncbi:MAG: YihY/virulence factor BrkB family protein, partial [Tannerellaceae bacterium]
GNDERITYYQPAVDINKLSVGYLFTKIDEFGSENFKIDTQVMFNKQWQTLLDVRKQYIDSSNSILLKDL